MFSYLIPLAVLYAVVCVAMFMLQRTLIYHPVIAQSNQYPPLKVETSSGYFAVSAHQNESDHAIIYFGGNAEDVSQTMPSLVNGFPDYCVYAMQYPGYGASPGSPNQTKIVQNAMALYDFVKARHDRIIVVGRSLGSGVAMQMAGQNKLDRLVLVTPFDSLADVAQSTFPFLPAKWLVMDRFDSAAIAPNLDTPTMVLIAAQDEVVPRANSDRLVSLFPKGVCTHHVIDPADHNSLELPEKLLNQFLAP
ncbi:MAG: alpha/beta hydrolase [Pirellulales bacterium]